MNFVLIHYNEIALKGGNRAFFEAKLIENIKIQLGNELPASFEFIKKISGGILIKLNQTGIENSFQIKEILQKTFGIANFSFANKVSPEIESLKQACWELLENRDFDSFRVSTTRSDKNYPLISEEINRLVGEHIFEKLSRKKAVGLKNPDLNIRINIFHDHALVFADKFSGLGGMPVATNGKVMCLISGGFDSPIAAWQLLKRGAQLRFVHFHSIPYTSKDSVKKIQAIIKQLGKFQAAQKTYLVPFADAQKEIMLKTPAKFRVILYRRLMLKIAQELARRENCLALVTGDSLGQVASQTLENIHAVDQAANMPVFRPLIGTDKEEIMQKAREIGTYEISILPHDDCCTRLMPKNPETRARLEEVLEAEKTLDLPELTRNILEKTELAN